MLYIEHILIMSRKPSEEKSREFSEIEISPEEFNSTSTKRGQKAKDESYKSQQDTKNINRDVFFDMSNEQERSSLSIESPQPKSDRPGRETKAKSPEQGTPKHSSFLRDPDPKDFQPPQHSRTKDSNSVNLDDEDIEKPPEEEKPSDVKEETTFKSHGRAVQLVDKIIDETPITMYHFKVYFILGLFWIADGAEMVVISLVVQSLKAKWDLNEEEIGSAGSIVFVGFFIGALIAGRISDSKGRKPTFVIGSCIVSLLSILSAVSPNFILFLVFRCMFGFGVGINVPPCTSLTGEISPSKYRSLVFNLLGLCYPLGEVYAILLAKSVLDRDEGWRWLMILCALPCFLSLVISFFISESPRFLLSVRQYDRGIKGLNEMLDSAGLERLSESQVSQIKRENEEHLKQLKEVEGKKQKEVNFCTIFNKEFIRRTVQICLLFFILSFIFYGITFILPQALKYQLELKKNSTGSEGILNSQGNFTLTNETTPGEERSELYDELVLSAFSELPSSLFAVIFANNKHFGRVRTMTLGYIIALVASFLCVTNMEMLSVWAAVNKFGIVVPFLVIYVYTAEAYPTIVRSLGIGVSNSANRLGGITAPFISEELYAAGPRVPFVVFGLLSAVAIVINTFLPFETLGRPIG